MTHKTIYDILKRQFVAIPDSICILGLEHSPITYSQLFNQVTKSVQKLNDLGINRNDRVAMVLPNGPEMATAFLSISSGATAAPLNPAYQVPEFEFFLSDLGAKALITQFDLGSPAIQVANQLNIPIIELLPDENYSGLFNLMGDSIKSDDQKSGFAKADDVALVLHTSGTTSRPKIVPLTQHNLTTSAHNIKDTLKLSPEDRCLNVMPLFHIHGLMAATMASILAGASLVCTPGFFAPMFFDWLKKYKPSWYTAVPTMHQAILDRAPDNMEIIDQVKLRFVRSSSASLPPKVMADLEGMFLCPVIEAYGMTEASHQMASNPLPPLIRRPGSVGTAAGPEVSIMEENGSELLPHETIGEIVIRGSNVTHGYENNPKANLSAFTNGWFRTGDQGYLDKDGYLFITGRLKEIINRGGEKISPREIDEILLEHPAVSQALAFSVPDRKLGEDIAAAVVVKDKSLTEKDIRQFVSKQLAHFKVPRRIIILDEIPKGSTGKLQRIGLAEKLGLIEHKDEQITDHFVKPQTHVEMALAELWCEVLGLEEVSVNQGFLSLGGDSILATQLITRIQQWMDIEITLLDFFDAPTIAEQAVIIEKLLIDIIKNQTQESEDINGKG